MQIKKSEDHQSNLITSRGFVHEKRADTQGNRTMLTSNSLICLRGKNQYFIEESNKEEKQYAKNTLKLFFSESKSLKLPAN